MIRAHHQAIIDRLSEVTDLQVFKFGKVPESPPEKYVVVHITNGLRSSNRETGPQARAEFIVTLHWVGYDVDQCQWVAEQGFAKLLNWVPTVSGRSCFRLIHGDSQSADADSSVQPVRFFAVDTFDFISDPKSL